MGVEGIPIQQGCGRKIFSWWPNSFYRLVIAALIVSIFAGEGQAGLFNNKKYLKPHTYKSVESENLSRRIKQLVRELEYSEEVAEDFVAMVNSWQNKKANQFFVLRRQKLHQVREDYKQGRIKISDIVKVEASTVTEIAWLIKNKLGCADEAFDMADVIKNKQASCLGYTQLFYILGNSIGLSVIPINAVELQAPDQLPTGVAHVSCIVSLSDGRTIMLNLVSGGFVSKPFIMEEKFTKFGNYWELNSNNNPLDLYRKIQLLDRDGLLAYIYNNRGSVYSTSGQYNQAILDYTKAIELNPYFAEAYSNRGAMYVRSGQLKRAISDLDRSIELNPKYAQAYNNRAIAYRDLGQFRQAIRDYNRAIELAPRFSEAFNNRAVAYLHLGRFSQAVSDYSKATKINPDFAEAYYNRGIAYGISGRFKQAIQDFDRAIKLNPNLARLYYNRGNAYGKLGQFKQAISDYTKAIKLDSNFTKAYNNRAISYALLGKPEIAKQDFLKAIKLNPNLKRQIETLSERFRLNLNLDSTALLAVQ